MIYNSVHEIFASGIIQPEGDRITVHDQESFRARMLDNLVDTIILSSSEELKRTCYWITYQSAWQMEVIPSSMESLYRARGKNEIEGFTVPAMNLRTLTYDLARVIFRAAKKTNAGAFIFEIAQSEIGYTNQPPLEYAAMILLAALKESYRGPIFLQGDHFQIEFEKYRQHREEESNRLHTLIEEAVACGFYQIDLDASPLVDLSVADISCQQRENARLTAQLCRFVRRIQPPRINILLGGEVGEVGGQNTTPRELRAFMDQFCKTVDPLDGLSKISIQTGTTHGGVILPDGSIAKVNIDFNTLRRLSDIARSEYGMAGAVQHGASTLPNEAFHRFPEAGCAEIHLATQFQNVVYDYLPLSLKEQIYAWLNQHCACERHPEWTDDQFIYRTRKKALGPFKRQIHSLTRDTKERIASNLESEFLFLFSQLKINDTFPLVKKYVNTVPVDFKKESFFR
ncbi:MAG: aldolase [Candidatus Omnitrophica bacterium]|nr:aldolase [Candidatus Omnitrophota bacterium]